MSEFRYVGSELGLFANAGNWKRYWTEAVRPFISGDVLEVGAGIGANSMMLRHLAGGRWVCLEPDPSLVQTLRETAARRESQPGYEIVCGTVASLPVTDVFDTILYIDVLEHIQQDEAELNSAVAHLRCGGHVIVLSPAHGWLYSEFDAAIGHYRRYNSSMLRRLNVRATTLKRVMYLDSAGVLVSSANRLLLRQSMPTPQQLRLWDRWIIPVSRVLDRALQYRIGKTILGVWRRTSA
jgi:SAM-dependent methyltransferase